MLTAGLLAGPAPVPTAGAAPTPRSFTLAAAGDVLIHSRLADLAARNAAESGEWDFWPMLAAIEPWVASADFSICHLESVLSSTNSNLSFYPRYIAPNQIADALQAAGWDACSVASNHALDDGFDGVTATLDELDARGIGHSGTARSPDERLPSLYQVNGITIAHLSFSQHFNGLSTPKTRPWAANQIDVETILSDARWARSRGAEFVILSLHWGVEFASNPVEYQYSIARAVLQDPAVDLILGHHPHVVEPIGMVEGKYVVFSMGNHLSNQHPAWGPKYYATNEGQLVFIHVVDGPDGLAVTSIDVVPTWVRLEDLQVFAAQDALRLGIEPERVLTRSIERTMERTLRLGVANVRLAPDPWPSVSCDGIRATILGTDSADVLTGSDAADVIVGRGGDDTIRAGPGDDIVCAGAGDDRVDAGTGIDRVYGGPGSDSLRGAGPINILFGGIGTDECWGIAIVIGCENR
ncbi:MAG: CapA family protein [Acidobacteria bacterium]|nr:CapA family protein [Acidobacteriota bacterium]